MALERSSRKLGVLTFVLAGIALIGGVILLRSRLQTAAEVQFSKPPSPMPGAGATPSVTLQQSAALPPEIPTRTRAQRVAATRALIHEAQARWKMGWAKEYQILPPLPKDKEFWSLIEALKKELGPEAAAVLSDLIDEAAAPRTEQLYTALLAGLKDPAALARLGALASATGKLRNTRGLALYGLGLLGTESAWKAAQEAWEKDSVVRQPFLCLGMGLFGDRGFHLILKEAEGAPKGTGWAVMIGLPPSGVRDRLLEILESPKDDGLRRGALNSLMEEPDAKTVSRLFDLLERPDRPKYLLNSLQNVFIYGFSLEADPRLLERVLSTWESLTPELRWALWCDPAVRRANPGAMDSLPPPSDFKYTYLYSLASDPARQGQVADYVCGHISEGSLNWLEGAFSRQNGFTDPSLAALARSEALRSPGEEGGRQGVAWRALAIGPSEARIDALADASKLCEHLPREVDRLHLVANMSSAGPDAAPVAVDLLRRETDPLVRMELMVTALSTPGREAEIRTVAGADIDQILSGMTDTAMRFAVAYPGQRHEGLKRYAELVRQVFSAYGTPADIPKIREYFSALLVPNALRTGKDGLDDVESREWLKDDILESIDAIRARN
jgi:hypothetical protein